MSAAPEISILVPTLGRGERLPGLAENVEATTRGRHWQLVFVLDRDDDLSWEKVREVVRELPDGRVGAIASGGTYPEKTNVAYRWSTGTLVLPTADDVIFKEGWLPPVVEAMHRQSSEGEGLAHVVGTNDLSPMSHEDHATMPVIRRAYIEAVGAVYGETGVVFSEEYRHNFVETEVCALARHRGVWAYEPASVIEHLHPAWGTREGDATDAKGNQCGFDVDRATFAHRQSLWSGGLS